MRGRYNQIEDQAVYKLRISINPRVDHTEIHGSIACFLISHQGTDISHSLFSYRYAKIGYNYLLPETQDHWIERRKI